MVKYTAEYVLTTSTPIIMAQSSNYFGLRRGSTKSHTFSVVDGKQITKDRVEGPKNPRTLPQMTQRCMVATIGTAYSAMKGICDHSFEGKSAGLQCMRAFMSTNLKHIQISKAYNNGLFGFNKYHQPGLVPGCYVIADGSLPTALADAEVDSVNVADKKLSLNLASGISIADIAEAMGCKNFEDMCTVAIMYPKADGSYGFGAVRFTYKSGESVLESFSVAVIGDIAAATPSFTAHALKLEVRMAYNLAAEATADNTYLAAITSRKVNGNWLRSPAQFDVEDATPTFAAAIATYPVGQERFLNGSDVDSMSYPASESGGESGSDNGGGSGSDSGGSGSQGGSQNQPTTFALTISTSGSGSASVTHNGNAVTSGSTLSEDDELEISITPAEGQTPTATLNGSSIELTESEGVYTGNFAMPAQASTLVINTGSGGGNGGADLDKD